MSLIVARASSRMFGGLYLSRNEGWIRTTLDFASDGFVGAMKIKAMPNFTRPLLAPWIPEVRRMRSHYNAAREAIVPILQAREVDPNKPSDFLQWMTDDAQGSERDPANIAKLQLKLSFAALHSTSATAVQLLYDICSMPEYITPLCEEIKQVQAKHESWTKQALLELDMMDSFMRESLRHNPLLLGQSLCRPPVCAFPVEWSTAMILTFIHTLAKIQTLHQSPSSGLSIVTSPLLTAFVFPLERQ